MLFTILSPHIPPSTKSSRKSYFPTSPTEPFISFSTVPPLQILWFLSNNFSPNPCRLGEWNISIPILLLKWGLAQRGPWASAKAFGRSLQHLLEHHLFAPGFSRPHVPLGDLRRVFPSIIAQNNWMRSYRRRRTQGYKVTVRRVMSILIWFSYHSPKWKLKICEPFAWLQLEE